MTTLFKPIFKTAMAIVAVAVLFTACDKENASPLKMDGQARILTCDTTQYTYASKTSAPAGPWASLYLDVTNGDTSSTYVSGASLLELTSNVNSTLNPIASVSTLRYLNSTKSICDLDLTDWSNATDTASLGQTSTNTPPYNGYFFYPMSASASAVPNFYVFVEEIATGDIWAIKYRVIRGIVVTPSPLRIKGEYDVTVRKL